MIISMLALLVGCAPSTDLEDTADTSTEADADTDADTDTDTDADSDADSDADADPQTIALATTTNYSVGALTSFDMGSRNATDPHIVTTSLVEVLTVFGRVGCKFVTAGGETKI